MVDKLKMPEITTLVLEMLCFACLVAQSCASLETLWTVAHQPPLSMGFFRQEYWSRMPFPPPGDLPNPGIKPTSPCIAGGFFTCWAISETLKCFRIGKRWIYANIFLELKIHFLIETLIYVMTICSSDGAWL